MLILYVFSRLFLSSGDISIDQLYLDSVALLFLAGKIEECALPLEMLITSALLFGMLKRMVWYFKEGCVVL